MLDTIVRGATLIWRVLLLGSADRVERCAINGHTAAYFTNAFGSLHCPSS